MLETNKAIEKYIGKTIRIENTVYIINANQVNGVVKVYLDPKFDEGYCGAEAWSNTRTDDYRYTQGGSTYQLAVDKAKEILTEIEEAEVTDF